MIVAIDGTVSSGKSTVAKLLANKLKFLYFNTGAIYRTIALIAEREGFNENQQDELVEILKASVIEEKMDENGDLVVLLNDENVTDIIYTPHISNRSADFSVLPKVREFVRSIQHKIADNTDCVVEGRDIGTIVFPNADVKFFITAPAELRARRRLNDYIKQGKKAMYNKVLKDIVERDEKDQHRSISPLKESKDGILINNNANSPEPTVEKMAKIVKEKIERR